jgi:exodeoxyribonuclease V beta subunit
MADLTYPRPLVIAKVPLDRHAVIEASAGTGKTFTIEHLVIRILLETDMEIDRILVVTFTEKAAGDLRKRIRERIDQVLSRRESESETGGERITVSAKGREKLEAALFSFGRAPIHTIHSFCQQALTELAFLSGLPFRTEVDNSGAAFIEAFRAELRENFAVNPGPRKLLEEWLADRPAGDLEKLLDEARKHRCLDRQAAAERSKTFKALAGTLEMRITSAFLPAVNTRMERIKRESSTIDYDDMLAWLARALDDPEGGEAVTSRLRDRFRFGLIDEFQDTDDLQWRIFRKIFVDGKGGNVLHVIGDPKQAIYAFRGADVFAYLAARDYLLKHGAEQIDLVGNFRSTRRMIDRLNLIMDERGPEPLLGGEIKYDHPVECGKPEMRAVDSRGEEIEPITFLRYLPRQPKGGRGDGVAVARERLGRHIARTIYRILNEPDSAIFIIDGTSKRVEARDIFILTRSWNEARIIAEYLREVGVTYAFYKQDGLFQTPEASDVLDLLHAIEEPTSRSRRQRAWLTPFFAVRYNELPKLENAPPTHPLIERLFEWKELADRERFSDLFNRLLHQSGLVYRELFLANSERELTNYQHIFEVLLEQSLQQRLTLREVIKTLDGYIHQRMTPPGVNGNVQRLESERTAVQIMTVHLSKGLEAGVVFVFGGTSGFRDTGLVSDFHDGRERLVAVGKEAKDVVKEFIGREREAEDRRLLYVAITRPRVKLYLALFPQKALAQFAGYYKYLNRRLERLIAESQSAKRSTERPFEVVDVGDGAAPAGEINLRGALRDWMPNPRLLSDDDTLAAGLDRLRGKSRGLRVLSYTLLDRIAVSAAGEVQVEDFKTDFDDTPAASEIADLPGGRRVGIFLHEVIEAVNLQVLNAAQSLAEWKSLPEVQQLISAAMHRNLVSDPRWRERGAEIVFNSFKSPIVIGDAGKIEALAGCKESREMEFLFPIPEQDHRLLCAAAGEERWKIDRGVLVGFVDFVFSHGGRTYFADWKSDLLRSYDCATVATHVASNYRLQAQIYTVGVLRLLGIRDESEYERRFGGLLYLFIRGITPGGDGKSGVYFHRPAWSDVVRYEAELMKVPTAAGSWR